jgi:murein DD-endopeptidase MepM/ murein hydrolase activator NlpD
VSAPEPTAPVELEIRPGESLPRALARAGIDTRDRVAIGQSLRAVADPRRLRPGERVAVQRDDGGRPIEVTLWRSPLERLHLSRAGDRWVARPVVMPADTQVAVVSGTVRDSLFASVEHLGESPALTVALVGLFEWDFDFAADSMPGDRFRLLVEKRYAGEQFVGYGPIQVAQYLSVDRPAMTSLAFPDATGEASYFDGTGRSVRKTFLRAPLDFTRITSGFSHARRHPVLGGLRPHLAVDYGAPTGTPVRAVADGSVVSARANGGYGLSVVLRHARGYETMYNHLSQIAVRPGQRVRQRDVIGRVGSTGLSTGPHLDYRVAKNGRFVNPLAERFLPGEPVPPERRAAFQARLRALLEQLDREAPL